jgi:hypothetical protein
MLGIGLESASAIAMIFAAAISNLATFQVLVRSNKAQTVKALISLGSGFA